MRLLVVVCFDFGGRDGVLLLCVLFCRMNRDDHPLPPKAAGEEEDEALLEDYPWVEGPLKMDYGYNVKCVLSPPFGRTNVNPS